MTMDRGEPIHGPGGVRLLMMRQAGNLLFHFETESKGKRK